MKKILLIEDHAEMRENIAEILELAQYQVLTAENGKSGVEIALAHTPDCIVCDIMLPELDGYGVLHLLSKHTTTARIPFIFLTARSERADMRRGMELGADDYLAKPFQESELLAAVESRLRKSEIMKESYQHTMEGVSTFFNDASRLTALPALTSGLQPRTYAKGEIVYKEGSLPNALFFLSHGKVKSFRTHETGKDLITALHAPGDFFGYVPLLEDSAYTDSAEAIDQSEILVIPKSEFFTLLLSSRDVAPHFIRLMAHRLADKESELLHLAYNSVRKRVADALLKLQDHYNNDNSEPFRICISRDDLASLAGTATETTIRTLRDLKDERLIEIDGSSISIVNEQKLRRMRS